MIQRNRHKRTHVIPPEKRYTFLALIFIRSSLYQPPIAVPQRRELTYPDTLLLIPAQFISNFAHRSAETSNVLHRAGTGIAGACCCVQGSRCWIFNAKDAKAPRIQRE